MKKEDIIEECSNFVYKAVEELNDEDYIYVLEELVSRFDGSVQAKEEELNEIINKRAGDLDG